MVRLKFGVDFEVGEGEYGENEGELGDADAGGAEGVDDEPRVGEPSDFGKNEAGEKGEEVAVAGVGLDEDMVGGGIAKEEGGGDENDGVGEGGKNTGGGGAEDNSNEGLGDGEGGGGAGLDQDEPSGVADHEEKVDGEPDGAGAEGEQDKTGADDEINKAGAEVEEPVAVVDGKNAPLGDEDEDEADDAVAGEDGDADRGDSQQEVEEGVEEGTERIATFANKNIICHGFIIAEKN